jgi:hypothetical protein
MPNMTWMQGCTKTRYAGIFKTKSGYRVRVRAMDPRTGTLKEANRECDGVDLRQALLNQAQMREEIRRGSIVAERLRVGEYAKHWIESKAPTVDPGTADATQRLSRITFFQRSVSSSTISLRPSTFRNGSTLSGARGTAPRRSRDGSASCGP